jgi:cation transport regulator ChaB
MPYENISDLPVQLRDLPNEAKRIFIPTFNSAFNQYQSEEKAFAFAWDSVKKKYKKEGDSWMEKASSEINDFEVYCDFQKMDEEQRMVYGYATTDALDSQGEIVELDATERAVEDYKKWRNIREMHGPSVAGTAPVIEMRKNGLWLGAKIDDDMAWKKVKSGAYKGFSIGGKKLNVLTEFHEGLKKNVTRIKDYLLTEISLVDRPANPLATFSFIKRDIDSNEVKSMDNAVAKEAVPSQEPQDLAKEVSAVMPVEAPAAIEKAVEAVPVEKAVVEIAKQEAVAEPVVAKAEVVEVVEETVSMKKSEYDALIKQSELVKKQDELLDMLKAQIEKKFASEEPKELVQKQDKEVPKSIGELSIMNGGWLSRE